MPTLWIPLLLFLSSDGRVPPPPLVPDMSVNQLTALGKYRFSKGVEITTELPEVSFKRQNLYYFREFNLKFLTSNKHKQSLKLPTTKPSLVTDNFFFQILMRDLTRPLRNLLDIEF